MSFISNNPKTAAAALALLSFGAGVGATKALEHFSGGTEPAPVTAPLEPGGVAVVSTARPTFPTRLPDAVAIDLELLRTGPDNRGLYQPGPKLELTMLPGKNGKLERLTVAVGEQVSDWSVKVFDNKNLHLVTFDGKAQPDGLQLGNLVSLDLPDKAKGLNPNDLKLVVDFEKGGRRDSRPIGVSEIAGGQKVERYQIEGANYAAGDKQAPPAEIQFRVHNGDELRGVSFVKTVAGPGLTGGEFQIIGTNGGKTVSLGGGSFEFGDAVALRFNARDVAGKAVFNTYQPQVEFSFTSKDAAGADVSVGPFIIEPFGN